MDKMMKLAIYGVLILGVAALGLSSSGCGDDDTDVTKDKAYLRVLHLSPDAPGVDVYANKTSKVVNDLMFLEGTSYLEVDAGTYDFNITATGSPADQSVLDINALALSKDTYYTAVAFDELGSIKAMPLVDDYDGLDSGDIRVRAIHAAEAVGQVDIWVIPETGNPSILYENVDFGVAGDYLDLPAAAYTLGFDLDNDAAPDVIFDVPALAAGTVANVFAVNDSTGAVSLQAQLRDGSLVQIDPRPAKKDSFIRVLHLSPDAPAVDVYVDGAAKVVEDLSFLEGTDYLTVEEGTYDFNITATGTPASQSVLDVTGLTLAGDAYYTAVAFDALSSIQAMALVDDYENLDAGNIRIRAIHAAEAVGQVDIWVIPETGNPSILYENVDFGVAGDYLDLPAAAYTLGFDLDDDATPDVIFDVPALTAGTIANVFAVNDSNGAVTLQAQVESGSLVQITPRPEKSDSFIRVLHLSPDAPGVDVYVDGAAKVVEDLAFLEGTGYLTVEEGTYDFNITATGTPADQSVLDVTGLSLTGDAYYTAVTFDALSSIQAMALVDDYENLDAGNIRIRAIHAAEAVGQVDIWVIPDMGAPSILYENVDFGVAGDYLDLPAAAYTLGFDLDDDATPDVIFDVPALAAGTVANVFAVNDNMGSVTLQAQLEDGSLVQIDHRT